MNGVLETDPRQYPWCTPSSGGVACLNELIRNITEKRHVPWISKYCKPSCVHQDYQVESKAPLKNTLHNPNELTFVDSIYSIPMAE